MMKSLLAISYLCLAAGMAYLGWSIVRVVDAVPAILDKLDAVLVQVDDIQHQVEKISRENVEPALDEIEQVRLLIPEILTEVSSVRQEVAKIETHIPGILTTVDSTGRSVSEMATAVEGLTPIIPEVVTEVENVRTELPDLMDRADQLVANARVAGQEAGKGAVTGLFGGIIAVPGTVLRGIASPLTQNFAKDAEKLLTAADKELIAEAAYRLWLSEESSSVDWNNPDTGHSGYLKTLEIYGEQAECKILELAVSLLDNRGRKVEDKAETRACMLETGKLALDLNN